MNCWILLSALLLGAACGPPSWKPTLANVSGLPEGMTQRLVSCGADAECQDAAPACAEAGSGRCVGGKCFYRAAKGCNEANAYDLEIGFCANPAIAAPTSTRCSRWVEQYDADAGTFRGCQKQLRCEARTCLDPVSGCSGEQRWSDAAGWSACNATTSCKQFMDSQSPGKLVSSSTAARVGKQVVYVKTDDGVLTAGQWSDRRTLTMRLNSLFTLYPQCDNDDSKVPPCCKQEGTRVKGVSWARFKLPAEDAKKALLCELNNLFSDFDVEFVDTPPASGDYAVLWYIEKDCKNNFLCELCHAAGVSLIDQGNANPNDLVLAAANYRDVQQMAWAGGHELGHALGLQHTFEKGTVMNPELDHAGSSWEPGHEVIGCCSQCNECKPGTRVIDTRAELNKVVPLAQPKDRMRCDVARILTGTVAAVNGVIRFIEDGTGTPYEVEGVLSQDLSALAMLEGRYPGITHMRVWGTVTPKLLTTDYRLLADRATTAPGALFVGDLSAPEGRTSRPSIRGWSGEYSSVIVAGPPEQIAAMQTVSGSRVWFLGRSSGEGTGCVGCEEEGRTAILLAVEWAVIRQKSALKLCGKCPAGYAPTMDGRCRKELPADSPIVFDKSTARNVSLFSTRIPRECTVSNKCRYEVVLKQRSQDVYCANDSTIVLRAICLHRLQNVASPSLVGYSLWKTTWSASDLRKGKSESLDCTSPDPPVDAFGQVAESYLSFARGEDGAYSILDNCQREVSSRRWVIETRDCPAP